MAKWEWLKIKKSWVMQGLVFPFAKEDFGCHSLSHNQMASMSEFSAAMSEFSSLKGPLFVSGSKLG